jgi:hypothetical protein
LDYITYHKNLEDEIGSISEELRALSQLAGYCQDIREGFPNDQVHLTREGISRIALNMKSRNCLKAKEKARESGPKSSNNHQISKPHTWQNQSRERDRHRQGNGPRDQRAKTMDDGKKYHSSSSRGPRQDSGRFTDASKKNKECLHYGVKGHFAKECRAPEPKCEASKKAPQGKAKAQ